MTNSRPRRFLMALFAGAILGAVVGSVIKYGLAGGFASVPSTRVEQEASGGGGDVEHGDESIAWQYVLAYQEGNWSRVVELTVWMNDRLAFVAQSGTPADVDAARDGIIEQISTHAMSENYLRDEGVDDQYLFTPGTRLEYIGEDGGSDTLEAPIARRTWFRVIYPTREKALLDKEGIPIRSVNAGVNVSSDGRVLKAGVVGNMNIDWDSIRYDWPSQ